MPEGRVQYAVTMKLNSRTRGLFLTILGLSLVIGTFAWVLLERTLGFAGIPLHLEVGPVGFDIGIIAFSIQVNPGTLLGIAPGLLIFKGL